MLLTTARESLPSLLGELLCQPYKGLVIIISCVPISLHFLMKMQHCLCGRNPVSKGKWSHCSFISDWKLGCSVIYSRATGAPPTPDSHCYICFIHWLLEKHAVGHRSQLWAAQLRRMSRKGTVIRQFKNAFVKKKMPLWNRSKNAFVGECVTLVIFLLFCWCLYHKLGDHLTALIWLSTQTSSWDDGTGVIQD